jgi:carotenoid cleavage dioxygenase-like enzyme
MNAPLTLGTTTNPYLLGNFGPISTEDDFELTLRGELPSGLTGVLYRTGPNPQFKPRDDNYHWFVGDGMVHAFHFDDGKVRYLNRWVRTPKWEAEHDAGRALFGSWGDPATTDPSVLGQDSGVANTNIVWHGGRLLALEEAHRPFAVDPATLAPLGYQSFGGAALSRFTAHPKTDPETGEMLFFGYCDGDAPLSDQVSYGVLDAAGRLTRHDRFQAPFASMIHDFMATRNHVLFPILPLTASLGRAMSGRPAFAWEPDKGAYVGVMERSAGVDTIRWFQTDANYVFHVMNAWEGGDLIVADVMQYEHAPLFPNPDGARGTAAIARLARWTFDLAAPSNVIRRAYIDDMSGEFPRIDDRKAGLAYRHGWFAAKAASDGREVVFDSIAHLDHQSGVRRVHTLPEGDVVSEPVFVARSADAEEGDGWLLATAYRGREDRSDLLVFEARDVAAGPIAAAELPRRVPFGFHGNWVGSR